MPIISNLTDRPVLLDLNSGQTLRLSPRSVSGEIQDLEIIDNARIAKLASRNIIALEESSEMNHAAGPAGEPAPATTSDRSQKPSKRSE